MDDDNYIDDDDDARNNGDVVDYDDESDRKQCDYYNCILKNRILTNIFLDKVPKGIEYF
jgi:hypothetical protein